MLSKTVQPHAAGSVWRKGVKKKIYDHVFSDLHHEVGGFLLGTVRPDRSITVDEAFPALRADGHTASLTFTHEAWEDVHRALEDRGRPEPQIVGWYHSHPGFGIFLSEHDLFIQRNFFDGECQIALVVDPHAGTEGTFGWRDGEIVKLDERQTTRPGQRPAPPGAPRPYPARAIALLAAVGVLVGAGTWFALPHGGSGGDVGRRTIPKPALKHDRRKADGRHRVSKPVNQAGAGSPSNHQGTGRHAGHDGP